MLQDLDGVEEFIRDNHEKLVAIGEVRECHMPEESTPFLRYWKLIFIKLPSLKITKSLNDCSFLKRIIKPWKIAQLSFCSTF